MIESLICLIIVVILTITVGELSVTYEFLASWVPYFRYAVIGVAVIFVIFALVKFIKAVKK